MSRKTLIVLAVGALVFAGAAFGQPGAERRRPATVGSPTFSSFDVDRDGRITREEASTDVTLVGRFERLDRDQDEAIDTAEFARFEAELRGGGDPRDPIAPAEPDNRPFPRTGPPPPPQP